MSGSLVVDALVSRGGFDVTAAFEARPGRPLALVGPNGAGKSTLVAAIAGLLPVGSGTILVDGVDVSTIPARTRGIGVVFQDFLLFPHLSVRDNVAFALRTRGARRSAARNAVDPWLETFDLGPLAARRPDQLSGGQKQRVALARALASEPAVLLLDEPMASMDVEVRDEMRCDLAARLRSFDGPTIVVTHDADDVAELADDVVVLQNGAVTQRGDLSELRAHPATPYVARLLR